MTTPTQASGRCHCGAVRFVARFPSRFVAHCHCASCRRAHGAAFVTWVGFQREQVDVHAPPRQLRRYKTETGATRSFCHTCGTTLFYESPRWPGELHIVRANFTGPIDRAVQGNAMFELRADWLDYSKPIARPKR